MAAVDPQFIDSWETPPWPVRRFTVEEYRKLGEIGVLTPEDRVELLQGWIVPKMNQKPAHGYAVGALTESLQLQMPGGFIVRCQLPITTANSEPEPDLAIVCGTHADFRDRHPLGRDCRLIIEVADTSVERDRLKATIYSSARVEEYWIFNLIDHRLEQFTQPMASGYQSSTILQQTQPVQLTLEGAVLRLELSDLLGQSR